MIDFIHKCGGFDVIHLNNIEGLSLSCLEIKKYFPNTKFIYSLHNYFPFCSRVDLVEDEDHQHNCNKVSYDDCIACYRKTSYANTIKRRRLESIGKLNVFNKAILKIDRKLFKDKETASLYEDFEKKNIEYINKYVDCVLAVSNRVREIAINHGLLADKVKVSYIGTVVAEDQNKQCNADIHQIPFNVIYMGYMREAKGFHFFLDCIEDLFNRVNNKDDLYIKLVAKYKTRNNLKELSKIKELKDKYKNIELINGYTKDNQKELLQGVNLGVVPVLWEDNLPQVAIEQMAYGVPIIVSDLGGAKELVNNDDFIFEAGNKEEFITKVVDIINHREKLNAFWDKASNLTTMAQHMNEVLSYYSN